MIDPSAWKSVLQEPNAAGWIGFLVLVIVIGAGVLYWGANGRGTATSARPVAGDYASK